MNPSRSAASAAALLLWTSLLTAPLSAQKIRPHDGVQPERAFRVGLGVLAGSAGVGAAIDASLDHGPRLYRVRLSAQDNAVMAATSRGGRLGVMESAFMLGRGRRYAANYGSVAAGLALVNVYRGADADERTTIGVPVEAQLISRGPLRMGATLAGNLNLEQPFGAFIFSVQIGRIPVR